MHGAIQTNYISETGNHAGARSFLWSRTSTNWFLISRVEVDARRRRGRHRRVRRFDHRRRASTADTNRRWPDHAGAAALPRRHRAARRRVNAGIGGNRVLSERQPASTRSRGSTATCWRRPASSTSSSWKGSTTSAAPRGEPEPTRRGYHRRAAADDRSRARARSQDLSARR